MGRKIQKGKQLGPNSIRAWRKSKNLTLDRLVARIRELGYPMTVASLGRIELRQQPYTQRTLEAIAEALGCEPADLIMRSPSSREKIELASLIDKMKPDDQRRALQVIKALAAA